MGRLFLLISALLLASFAAPQPIKEFKLSPEETKRVLSILNETYAKLKQLPKDSTRSSNVNSIDTKEKVIGGRLAFLTVDSCSEENGSSLCFTVCLFTQKKYPQDVVYFTYDPATKNGFISMFRITDPHREGHVYETSEQRVRSTFMGLIEKIEEFI